MLMSERETGQDTRPCPQCQAPMPVHDGYVVWCAQCGWNLRPEGRQEPIKGIKAIYARLGKRQSKRLYEAVLRQNSPRPRITPSILLAFLLAGFVYCLTLLSLGLAVWFLITGFANPVAWILVIIFFLAAWLVRPRLGRLPRQDLSRAEYPGLYCLADSVGALLGFRSPIRAVAIEPLYNASLAQVGLRRQTVLSIGLPLAEVLDGPELVALFAHEMAHAVNGDPNRGLAVQPAVNTLATWYSLLMPDRVVIFHPLGPFLVLLWLLAKTVWLGAYLLVHLIWREGQRAEYLADALAAEVAGTEAMVSMLDKIHLQRLVDYRVQQAALSSGRLDLFSDLRGFVEKAPPSELERIRRLEETEQERLDTTHPPTTYRLGFLRARPAAAPKLSLSAVEEAKLREELATKHREVQETLVEDYLKRIAW